MHKYEVVYFNISNVVLVYCERCVQNVINFIAHKPVKTECGNPVQLYLLKHWKELESQPEDVGPTSATRRKTHRFRTSSRCRADERLLIGPTSVMTSGRRQKPT